MIQCSAVQSDRFRLEQGMRWIDPAKQEHDSFHTSHKHMCGRVLLCHATLDATSTKSNSGVYQYFD